MKTVNSRTPPVNPTERLQNKLHIILIEENFKHCDLLKTVIDETDMHVRRFKDTLETVDFLKKNRKPDIIFGACDSLDRTGYHRYKQLKNSAPESDLPLVFLTVREKTYHMLPAKGSEKKSYHLRPLTDREVLIQIHNCRLRKEHAYRLTRLRQFAKQLNRQHGTEEITNLLFQHVTKCPDVKKASLLTHNNTVRQYRNDHAPPLPGNGGPVNNRPPVQNTIRIPVAGADHWEIAVELTNQPSYLDIEYYNNLGSIIEFKQENHNGLMSDPDLLHDLYIIRSNISKLCFIKTEARNVYLHLDKGKKRYVLHSRLKHIKSHFNDGDLVQISRYCLINPQKIEEVHKIHVGAKKNSRYVVRIGTTDMAVGKGFVENLKRSFPHWFPPPRHS